MLELELINRVKCFNYVFCAFVEKKEACKIYSFVRRNRDFKGPAWICCQQFRAWFGITFFVDSGWQGLVLLLSVFVVFSFWKRVIVHIYLTESLEIFFSLLNKREIFIKHYCLFLYRVSKFCILLYFSFILNCAFFLILLFQKNNIHLI